ncbi:hypothetical protein ECZU43_42830 [Escherichia coli]|nr:hypothetical protein ECZU43_42830 [Escherichia coli]
MAGTLPARVTSTVKNDIYAHIDKDGRYRVNLDFDRDTWKPGYESLWVRQSRPYAGDTYGLHLPLLAERKSASPLRKATGPTLYRRVNTTRHTLTM